MKLNEQDHSFITVVIHFLDKLFQEINFKGHLIVYCFVNEVKYFQICKCPVWFYVTLIVMSYGEKFGFVSFPIFGLNLVIKLRNFDF